MGRECSAGLPDFPRKGAEAGFLGLQAKLGRRWAPVHVNPLLKTIKISALTREHASRLKACGIGHFSVDGAITI